MVDAGVIGLMKENKDAYPSQLEDRLREQSDEHKSGLPRAIWNLKVISVGEKEATLKKVYSLTQGPIIIAQSDRPAFFYLNRDHL